MRLLLRWVSARAIHTRDARHTWRHHFYFAAVSETTLVS
jgi:hypothetical protein